MKYFKEQFLLHPSMQLEDVAKFCYQATFGAEHMLTDIDRAKSFLIHEFEQTPARNERLSENISEVFCRINLGAWKMHSYPIEDLFSLFLQTANQKSNATIQDLETHFDKITDSIKNGTLPFHIDEWLHFLDRYDRTPLHHSDLYRAKEKPAYRVVYRSLLANYTLYR